MAQILENILSPGQTLRNYFIEVWKLDVFKCLINRSQSSSGELHEYQPRGNNPS